VQQVACLEFILIDEVLEIQEKARHQGNNGDVQGSGEHSNIHLRISHGKSIHHESERLNGDDDGQVFINEQPVMPCFLPQYGGYANEAQGSRYEEDHGRKHDDQGLK
jgi:hypothetical protein